MKKNILIIILILLASLMLSACSKQADNTNATATNLPTQPAALQQPTDVPLPDFAATLPEGYDPASEEDASVLTANAEQNPVAEMPVYAGSSPIPIDPVDMPTPTPRQALTFTYAKYTADKLGLSFESIAGYEVDDTQPNVYILNEPASMVKDNFPVQITLSVVPVGNNYNINSLKSELKTKLQDLGKVNYKKWEPTNMSKRSLLGKEGYYANYRGEMFDDTIVRGRIHMALVNNKLITLNVACPGWYNTDYMSVYSHIRSTLKLL
ncbi:MAG: hypothetical protein Q4E07_01785 [Eubacteriales bacterium]|nr:hypothetical protein [Eubacteriales bacterium]